MKFNSVFAILAFCCCLLLPKSPLFAQGSNNGCDEITTGTLSYSGQEYALSRGMKLQLDKLKGQMLANPDCKVIVAGNAGGSKVSQQSSWDRVNTVIEYMSDQNNIARDRFIFVYDGSIAPENSVLFRAATNGEDGPSSVAPPHPDLRR
ncbi:MAG: hypothetical protein ABI378_02395 [Chitinophagaceae bacterium]